MLNITRSLRLRALAPSTRQFTISATQLKNPNLKDEQEGKGIKSHREDHVAESNDINEYQTQAAQGQQAKKDYVEGGKENADTRGDPGKMTKQAEKDVPEAPRPIIGMKEERGKAQE